MHDRALQDTIFSHNSCLPPDVRHAMLETARTGLAGPEAQRMAEEALAEDDDEKLLPSFFLFKSATEEMSGGSTDLRVSDLPTPSRPNRHQPRPVRSPHPHPTPT